jgi:WD40 repeat protein
VEIDNATPIHILDLKTRGVSTVPGSEGLYHVRWSPDGRYLAAKTSDNTRMMGFDFKTGKWSEWAKIGLAYAVNWSRDGNYLYFDSALGNEPAFYRLRVSDQKLERLVSLKELGRQAYGIDAPWTGLAPDDSPLALRDIGSQEIYALDWEAP